jgi:hypothetical protein
MSIYRLVYGSNYALKSSGAALAADLKRILASAIRHNPANGISGGLVFSHNHFVQVLEGPQPAVENTFSRIQLDPSHTQVIQVEAKPIAQRMFGAWSMGYVGNAALFGTLSQSLTADGAIDPRRIDVEDLVASVHHLVQTEMHMASTASLAASQTAA